MTSHLTFVDGWPVFQSGGIPDENSIELSNEQAAEVQSALAAGKRVLASRNGYRIADPEPRPALPEPTAAEKLQRAGLTVAELKQLLGLEATS